jgi:hypothetical protein
MSEKQLDSQEVTEKNTEVVITADDCNAALDFWKHFQIPIPTELEQAMAMFAKSPDFTNQEEVKLQICKAIASSDHKAFKDEMFTKIVEECAAVTFEMKFERDLEESLTSTVEEKTT